MNSFLNKVKKATKKIRKLSTLGFLFKTYEKL